MQPTIAGPPIEGFVRAWLEAYYLDGFYKGCVLGLVLGLALGMIAAAQLLRRTDRP